MKNLLNNPDLILKNKKVVMMLAFFWGVLLYLMVKPADHYGIRSSDVIVGGVKYPAESLIQYTYLKSFSLLKYLGALVIKISSSNRAASMVLGALSSGTAFLAVFLLFESVLCNLLLSFISALCLIGFEIYPVGLSYPMLFYGNSDTFGEIGSNLGLLVTALFLNKYFRAGFIVLFLVLLSHPPHGMWSLCTWGGVFLLSSKWREVCKENWKVIIAGIMSVAIIYFLQGMYVDSKNISFGAFAFDVNNWKDELLGYIKYWEYHRRPLLEFKSPGEVISEISLWIIWILGIIFLVGNRKLDIKSPEISFMMITLIGGVVSLTASLAPNIFPLFFIRAMPMRFTNYLSIYSFILLMGGMLSFLSRRNYILLVFFLMSFKFKQIYSSLLLPFVTNDFVSVVYTFYFVVILLLVLSFILKDYFPIGLRRKTLVLMTLIFSFFIMFNLRTGELRSRTFIKKIEKNDSLFNRIQKKVNPGYLLIAAGLPCYQYQLKTRMPVLFYPGAFDYIHYNLKTIPPTEKILNDIYGMTLAKDPAPGVAPHGSVPLTERGEFEWEERSLKDWELLSRNYKFCTIVTSSKWQLNLDKIDENEELAFWNIPNCSYQF